MNLVHSRQQRASYYHALTHFYTYAQTGSKQEQCCTMKEEKQTCSLEHRLTMNEHGVPLTNTHTVQTQQRQMNKDLNRFNRHEADAGKLMILFFL